MNIEEKLREKRWNRYFEKCLVALIVTRPQDLSVDSRSQMVQIAAIIADFADAEYSARFVRVPEPQSGTKT